MQPQVYTCRRGGKGRGEGRRGEGRGNRGRREGGEREREGRGRERGEGEGRREERRKGGGRKKGGEREGIRDDQGDTSYSQLQSSRSSGLYQKQNVHMQLTTEHINIIYQLFILQVIKARVWE